MKEVTLRLLSDLALAMEKDPRILALKKEEEALETNASSASLLSAAKKAREAYLTLRLELGEEDEKTVLAKKDFHQAKLRLEEEGAVSSYRNDYAEVSSLYRQIDSILFDSFRDEGVCKEGHASR